MDEFAEERNGRLDAVDDEFVERPVEPRHAFGPRAAVDDELADQAVVVGRDRVALIDAGIDAHAEPAGRVEIGDLARRRREGARVLGVDAAFDGVALEMHVGLRERQAEAGGDADLLGDQVDAGDRLGHRMLDLQAGVHLDEVELAVLVEELDRAGAGIAERGDGVGDDAADPGALLGIDGGRGGFFQDLLVAALQRAIALAEMDGAALAVAHHLHFDVARLGEVFLDIDGVVAESGARLGAGGGERVRKARRRSCATFMPRPPPPAAALIRTGIADVGGDLAGGDVVGDGALRARHHRDAEAGGGALGLDLVAHDADVLGARADEDDVVGGEDLGEAGVLRQEAVAGVDGLGAGDFAGGEQLRDVEVGFARRRRADADALVGEAHMHGVGVGGRMDRHGGDAQLLAGAQHPEGDLAAIGDEDLAEQLRRFAHSMIIRGSPNSTGWASSTRISITLPERGAGIWFIVFIASMIMTVWPSRTVSPIST